MSTTEITPYREVLTVAHIDMLLNSAIFRQRLPVISGILENKMETNIRDYIRVL